MQTIVFKPIEEADIIILTPIMKVAFDEDTRIHLGKEAGGPTGYDNGDFLRQYAFDEKATAFKILLGERIIGAVRLWINKQTQENYLGNIFVDVSIENSGLGKQIWDLVEETFPNTKIWRTDTPIYSRRNHHFYVNKCGFHIIKIENPKSLEEGSYRFEKVMK